MSLRSTINWLITLVMLLFIITLTALQIESDRRSIDAEMQAATRVTVQMLSNVISSDQAHNGSVSPELMATFLEHTGRIRAHDIKVNDSNGLALYTSPPSPYKSGRMAPHWFTSLVSPQVVTTTLSMDSGSLQIVPDYSRMVLDAWDELFNLFLLSLALFTLLNGLVFWFAGRALKDNRSWMLLIQRHIEEERRKLALELHDEVGQSLTAIKTIATTLANRTRDQQPQLHEAAQMIVTVSAQMYDSMHNMVRQLRPLVLDQLGLQAALQELVATHQARHPDIQLMLSISGELVRVNAEVGIAAYRMVQECLTNIARHAGATKASIMVEATGSITITVQDNGHGARVHPNDTSERFGLIGMRERAEGLGGSFQWQGENGVKVVVSLPLQITEQR
ncbi:MAG: sensor histidine kinase [Gammaproteobacteria bacterium]